MIEASRLDSLGLHAAQRIPPGALDVPALLLALSETRRDTETIS